jgi:very-short-patch-repair endonuclease
MPVKNIIPGQKVSKEKLQHSRELRRDMTPAEKILWQELRANKLGVHFRRQQVIAGFIVDFYCHKEALVIEVDGDIHDLQQEEDARREKVLSDMGLRIVRFRNNEVLRNLPVVVGRIKENLSRTCLKNTFGHCEEGGFPDDTGTVHQCRWCFARNDGDEVFLR